MKLRITIEGRSYEVDVDVLDGATAAAAPVSAPRPVAAPPAPAPTAAPAPAPAAAPRPSAGPVGDKVCKAPIAGVVVKIIARVGQTVNETEPILVMEAMKMETNIASPFTGTIKSILVNGGDSVKQGQVLVEFE